MNSDITIAILLGGASSEREVSKLSAAGVLGAVKELGYKYKLIDPSYGTIQPESDDEFFISQNFTEPNSRNYLNAVSSHLFDGIDVVFNALHGTWGEDGTIQSLLEFRGIKYTGSGVLPCSISMNKIFTKVMFQHYDVITPLWKLVRKTEKVDANLLDELEDIVGLPCAVKPNNQGSAIGLSICKKRSEIESAVCEAAKYSDEILVEEYIAGYELTVGILNGHAFPPLEIKPKHDFYDYTCKYTHGMSDYEVPARFPAEVLDELKKKAILAYQSINCSSYGRIDFRLNNEFVPYCLEVNTLPGLTSTSLLPKTAKADGLSFVDLIEHIIKNSLNS